LSQVFPKPETIVLCQGSRLAIPGDTERAHSTREPGYQRLGKKLKSWDEALADC